jgi:hypothetical protein
MIILLLELNQLRSPNKASNCSNLSTSSRTTRAFWRQTHSLIKSLPHSLIKLIPLKAFLSLESLVQEIVLVIEPDVPITLRFLRHSKENKFSQTFNIR